MDIYATSKRYLTGKPMSNSRLPMKREFELFFFFNFVTGCKWQTDVTDSVLSILWQLCVIYYEAMSLTLPVITQQ